MVIQHAETEFSTLCHLMSQSITVQVGQRVRRGNVIARCGNLGNTSEPHLHFQVQNTKGFYASIGLPLRFAPIRKSLMPMYEKIDPRPMPDYENLNDEHIATGFIVENIT